MKNDEAYLFSYFAGESYPDGEQVYFAISRDGLNWQDLNRNQPVLYSDVGAKGIRDPVIIRSEAGDRFWMIATDERIHPEHDWKRAVTSASHCMVVWESPDLIRWTQPRLARIAPEDAGCTWAPEATYDPKTGTYLVYWASTTARDGFKKQRIYCSSTRDFNNFSPPEVYIEDDDHVIDTTIIEHDGIYYRYSRKDTLNAIVADCVTDLRHGSPRPISAPFLAAQPKVEGPFVFKLINRNEWCLLVDNHVGVGYYPLITNNLASGEFRLPDVPYRMPTRARHGGVLSITGVEFNALLNKWGT